MKHAILSIFAFTLLVGFSSAVGAQDARVNKLTKQERQAGWRTLFNGKKTNKWRNYKKEEVGDGWKVEEGELRYAEKGAGDLITKAKFAAFEFKVDYKISKAGNSGLMYHVTEDNDTPWQSGPEIQIQDNIDGHDAQKSGWLYALYNADIDATNPPGEWNRLHVLITPEKCVHYMNGKKYCEYVKGSDDWDKKVAATKFAKFPNFGKATKGHICLQDHGNEVAFRNIKIRVIGKNGETVMPKRKNAAK